MIDLKLICDCLFPFKVTGSMSKSMPVIIDTSDATKLITSTSTETVIAINHLLSKISQSTSTSSMPSILSTHQSFSTVANPRSNGQDTTAPTPKQTMKNRNNIQVIVPRYQNAASTKNSKSHTNIPTGLAFVVCVLLMLFLVMSSICLIKQRRKSMECDKKMLIGTIDVVNGSECELNIAKRNIYLV